MFLGIMHAWELARPVRANESVAQGDDLQLTLGQRINIKGPVLANSRPAVPLRRGILRLLTFGPHVSDRATIAHRPRNGVIEAAMNTCAGLELDYKFVRLAGHGGNAGHGAKPGRTVRLEMNGSDAWPAGAESSRDKQTWRGTKPEIGVLVLQA